MDKHITPKESKNNNGSHLSQISHQVKRNQVWGGLIRTKSVKFELMRMEAIAPNNGAPIGMKWAIPHHKHC